MNITSENATISFTNSREASIQYIPTPLTGYQSLMGFHRHLLEDSVRTSSFIQAIQKVVKKGDVVLDLGSGTGILAMACCKAGAKRVYAIESDRLIFTAQQAARANELENQIVFIHKDSRQVTLPEKLDVIVSECLGLMGVGGTMIPAVVDMARRFLKKGGRLIPSAVSLFLAPVESPLHYDYVHVWDKQHFYGFDFSPFQKRASNNLYIAWFQPESFLGEPQKVSTIHLLTDGMMQLDAKLRFSPTKAGHLHGFCGWFEADLGGGITLSASPLSEPTIWKQLYLPLEKEIEIEKSSLIDLDFGINIGNMPGDIPSYFRWSTNVYDVDGQREPIALKQITLKSVPKNLAQE